MFSSVHPRRSLLSRTWLRAFHSRLWTLSHNPVDVVENLRSPLESLAERLPEPLPLTIDADPAVGQPPGLLVRPGSPLLR